MFLVKICMFTFGGFKGFEWFYYKIYFDLGNFLQFNFLNIILKYIYSKKDIKLKENLMNNIKIYELNKYIQ